MEDNSTTPAPAPKKVIRIQRFQIGLNVLIQIIITVLIVGMINYLSYNHFRRWDLSRSQKYSISDQTKRVLRNLNKEVKFIVFFSSASDLAPDVTNLLKEYQYAGKKKVEVEVVDPYRNFSRARELASKYKFGATENIVIVDYAGQSKFVNAQDMADYDTRGMAYGERPQLTAFKGEQALTSALIAVSEEKKSKVYFVTGHGEADISRELQGASTFIQRQNIDTATLNLAEVEKIPDDANGLIIPGAKYDLNDRELKILRDYWEKKGRLFVLLDPTALTPKLHAFLAEQGVTPQADRVLRLVNLGPVAGIMRDVSGVVVDGNPITKRLKGINVEFLSATQSLGVPSQPAPGAALNVKPILLAAEGYWGETNYDINVEAGESLSFDPSRDHGPPVVLAASIEKGGLSDDRVKVESSRMIVAGNALFLVNEAMTQADLDFALAGLNWLLDREELTGITPKQPKTFTLNLSEEQLGQISVLVLGGMPAVVALVGIGVWLSRRR